MKQILAVLLFSLACSTSFAADINLYDQPKTDAKAIAKIDPAIGIIPIFSSKDGVWLKVGDPRNGNVGWIKNADLSSQNGINSSYTFSQKIVNDGKTVTSPTLQVGPSPTLTPEQAAIMRRFELQKQVIQRSMQENIRGIVNDLSRYYDEQVKVWNSEQAGVQPVPAMPVAPPAQVVPANKK
ncbi:MAG: hypothetical protein ACYC0J_03650 [Gammaproteobacteria bacterium]